MNSDEPSSNILEAFKKKIHNQFCEPSSLQTRKFEPRLLPLFWADILLQGEFVDAAAGTVTSLVDEFEGFKSFKLANSWH